VKPGSSAFYYQDTTVASNDSIAALDATVNLQNSGMLLGDNSTTLVTLAVRRNAPPSIETGIYDNLYQVTGQSQTFTIELPVPNQIYFFEINNPSTVTYTITFSSNITAGCNSKPNCNANITELTTQNNATLMTGIGDYQYFFIQSNNLMIGTGTKSLKSMAPSIAVSPYYYPSNDSALMMDNNKTVNFISASDADNGTVWFVSVYASEGYQYYIWANMPCPNNCSIPGQSKNSTHGTCNENTGYCTCDKHYGNLWCSKTGLATVWIVLIVIACAIILAIAIGVPVALYLRSQRRARYERV